jgi:hypothetical protein
MPNFAELPAEVIIAILQKIRPRTVDTVALQSRRLRDISRSNLIWNEWLKPEYKVVSEDENGADPREARSVFDLAPQKCRPS